ncbi:MAG: hypothetical protein Q4F72_11560, partial [Desulfovibrionaceae bacterium]|nr:hypothetical protein [Desulfovibrionaceae bacterium]
MAADWAAVRCLGEAAALCQGRYLLFARDGVELPVNFDQAVWLTMRQEKCRAGGFSLPLDVPSLRRTMRWLGTAMRPGALAGPGLEQGLFVPREDFLAFGGLGDPENSSPDKALAQLAARAGQTGRVILHNARVRFLKPMAALSEDEADGAANDAAPGDGPASADAKGRGRGRKKGGHGAAWLAGEARGKITTFLAAHGRQAAQDDRALAVERLNARAAEMVSSCDHCGRCTHVSPMLHRHGMDLADLTAHPLLAWHCFMCGACKRACHKGIDGAELARTLRAAHVMSHGNRLARPGHGVTLALAKAVPVYARRARKGLCLLLEPAFMSSYPATAALAAKRLWQAGLGVMAADSGADLAALGLESQARAQLAKLKKAMSEKGVTALLTMDPGTQRWLAAMGVEARPVLAKANLLGIEPLSMEGRKLLVPCQDRGRKVFLKALAPHLRGEVTELDVPCCGAGGEAAVLEPATAA